MKRLTTGSPHRIHTINYILGTGEVNEVERVSVPSFQGFKDSYKDIKKLSMHNDMFNKGHVRHHSQYTNLMDTKQVKDMRRLMENKKVYHGRNDSIMSLKQQMNHLRNQQIHSDMK